MFLDGGELVEFELQVGKPKTVCMVTNINTICNCHQRGPSLVSTTTRYRTENQLGIHSSNSNGRIGNEVSVLDMGTALPASRGVGTTHVMKPAVSRLGKRNCSTNT